MPIPRIFFRSGNSMSRMLLPNSAMESACTIHRKRTLERQVAQLASSRSKLSARQADPQMLQVNSCICGMIGLRFRYTDILQLAQSGYFNDHFVAGLEPFWRMERKTYSRRRSGRDHIARLQRHHAGKKLNGFRNAEDLLAGI